ncbi:chain-length determining protein [Cupriavidus oxalaticus]|uniref:Chain-length determining protein n=1 Tax=Cupriavidus oxalaticus TaxID=96344 RepID=A0A4P7L2W6_9BURK|nr:chain-length determining protein [Cupriavidus oxalaticus]QBY49674.1 chain-length determining protein [Cupriavidus oxalaticus]
MTDTIESSPSTSLTSQIVGWPRRVLWPALKRRQIIGAAVLAALLGAIYWLAIASDRYVSEAHVIVQSTDLAGGQTMDFSSLLNGGSGGSRADQLLLRDHLLSVDMLRKLDAALNLRAHYSDWHRDPLSRLWFKDAPLEWFHRHYLTRVSVEMDDYAGVLVVRAQGYDPKTAHAITAMLVREGERFMNDKDHALAQSQVAFLEEQVLKLNQEAVRARQKLLDFQDKKGLVSPQATAENLATIVARLEAQRTELETQRRMLQAYLVPNHPNIVQLDQQIAAVERQMTQEQAKLASPGGKTLNRTVEEFRRLEMEAGFAQDVYKTALVALEKGRIEATRMIKKVSVLQTPTRPEYPIEPRRFYNTLVFVLAVLLMAGVVQLLVAIVRDHKD